MKYKELLGKAKDVKEQILIPFKVRKAKKDLEKTIIETEQEIAEADLGIEEEKQQHPVCWTNLLTKINKRDLKKRALKQLKELETELFD